MREKNSIYRRAMALAVPMMIQNGITNMVGLVDSVMVGSLGTEAMTAVSIIGQLIFVFNLGIFGGISGPGIYAAQFYGQGNTEGFRSAFRMKRFICLFFLIVGVLAFVFGDEFLIGLYLKGESESIDAALTMQTAQEYLKIMLFGLLPFVITQIYASSLRESGDSIKPMTAGIVSVVVDIVFNYLLIFGKFGFPELGVKGAAIATVLARIVEMLVVVIWSNIRKDKHEFLQGLYKTFLVPKELSIKMLKKGFPIFFNEFLWAGGLAVLTQTYSIRGLEIVAGLNISNALCNLLNVVFVALGNAVGILIGQTLGAGEYDRAKKDSFGLMKFTGGICLILTAALISVSHIFPMVYDTTDEVRSLGSSFIIITAAFFPVQGYLNAMYFTLRSGGKTFITFLFDSVFTWVFTVPLAVILCNLTSLPILAVYAIVNAADIIKVMIGYILIRKGIWISSIVEETA
ncbi:MAG: MATE family efflux transporter [Oscillospiraceae bacterium]